MRNDEGAKRFPLFLAKNAYAFSVLDRLAERGVIRARKDIASRGVDIKIKPEIGDPDLFKIILTRAVECQSVPVLRNAYIFPERDSAVFTLVRRVFDGQESERLTAVKNGRGAEIFNPVQFA